METKDNDDSFAAGVIAGYKSALCLEQITSDHAFRLMEIIEDLLKQRKKRNDP